MATAVKVRKRNGKLVASSEVPAPSEVPPAQTKSKAPPPAIVCDAPNYRNPAHADLPHVVKMSGGRSSAMMALSLARAGVLRPERNDVVLFANTTAEHPGTYRFAAQVCDELESVHGLPCLWYEYCTAEMATRNGWQRRATYRLVKRTPYSEDDPLHIPGYRSDGSAFEAMTSMRGMLPSRHLRMCTEHLKILPGVEILAEWLSGSEGIAHAGHHYGRKFTSAAKAFDAYRGEMKEYRYKKVKAAVHKQPVSRPEQNWADFTTISRSQRTDAARPKVDIWGQQGHPVEFVTLLGLRADEPKRIRKMEEQAMFSEGAWRSACRDTSRPAGELTYAPLGDSGVSKSDVMDFWGKQNYDLPIDTKLGNCVFCFMKGENALGALATADDADRMEGQPTDIGWWADLENKYALPSKKGRTKKFLFLSLGNGKSFAKIADDARNGEYEIASPPPSVQRAMQPAIKCPATARTDQWHQHWSSPKTGIRCMAGNPRQSSETILQTSGSSES